VVLADLFDVTLQLFAPKAARRIGPHPARPWHTAKREHWGNTGGRTREQVEQLLAQARQGAFA
jgi:hypothetical protein